MTSGSKSTVLTRLITIAILLTLVAGCSSRPATRPESRYDQVGLGSYYALKFHGHKTASGERYNQEAMTAAHRHLPFGSMVKVTNLENGKWVEVRVNDRGPFVKGRIIDVSYAAAKKLKMIRDGVVRARVERIR
jgi:rare lipoprotein A